MGYLAINTKVFIDGGKLHPQHFVDSALK